MRRRGWAYEPKSRREGEPCEGVNEWWWWWFGNHAARRPPLPAKQVCVEDGRRDGPRRGAREKRET